MVQRVLAQPASFSTCMWIVGVAQYQVCQVAVWGIATESDSLFLLKKQIDINNNKDVCFLQAVISHLAPAGVNAYPPLRLCNRVLAAGGPSAGPNVHLFSALSGWNLVIASASALGVGFPPPPPSRTSARPGGAVTPPSPLEAADVGWRRQRADTCTLRSPSRCTPRTQYHPYSASGDLTSSSVLG